MAQDPGQLAVGDGPGGVEAADHSPSRDDIGELHEATMTSTDDYDEHHPPRSASSRR